MVIKLYMDKKFDIVRENLAMKIMLLKAKQMKGEITFEEALKESVKLIRDYENE